MSKKTHTVIFRASPKQKAAWREAAEADGRTLSGWIRATLDKEVGQDATLDEAETHTP